MRSVQPLGIARYYIAPVLFLIYINDLPALVQDESLEAYLYVDDLAINIVHENKMTLNNKLEDVTIKIYDWCNANSLAINENKIENINFSSSRNNCDSENSVRLLGIHLEPGLGWQCHTNYLASKISKGIFMIRMLKYSVSTDSLLTVYYSHIFSYLNYGVLMWGNHPSAHALFVLQKRAIRLIYEAAPRTHCKPLFVRSGILTLPSMFVLACLIYVRSNIELFTVCSSVHAYSTRSNDSLYIDKCKYSKTQNSFLIVSIKLFNSLPTTIRNLPLQTFKRRVTAALVTYALYAVDEFYDITF